VVPNPAVGDVQISYSLPGEMTVRVEIYSADGRLIATPLNDVHRVAGNHSEALAGSNLDPGAYTVRLIAGRQSRVQQFIVVR
jgi:hypothetical protein